MIIGKPSPLCQNDPEGFSIERVAVRDGGSLMNNASDLAVLVQIVQVVKLGGAFAAPDGVQVRE